MEDASPSIVLKALLTHTFYLLLMPAKGQSQANAEAARIYLHRTRNCWVHGTTRQKQKCDQQHSYSCLGLGLFTLSGQLGTPSIFQGNRVVTFPAAIPWILMGVTPLRIRLGHTGASPSVTQQKASLPSNYFVLAIKPAASY